MAAASISVREAEPGFVGPENLEPGETVLRAVKAFDDSSGTLLVAGALLKRESDHWGATHDAWVADSLEKGVGTNMQFAAAQLAIDELFYTHLTDRSRPRGRVFNLLVGDGEGTSAASRAAALSRGFTRDALCEDTAESLLRYDAARGYDEYHKLASSSPTAKALLPRLPRQPMRRFVRDLGSDDWEPLETPWQRRAPWLNPCFFTSFITALSVFAAAGQGCFVPFGVGPLLVLLSSVAYWANPVKASVRRKVDLVVVRTGLACQVALAAFCTSHPRAALPRLMVGYALGMACYAVGRVLHVRDARWAGSLVHTGVHVFANLGNLLILPYAR